MSLQCLPSSYSSIQHMVWEMSLEDSKGGCCGGQIGYQNGAILAFRNLHLSQMPSTKFQLNLTYRSGANAFQHFQDGYHGGHLGYRNGTIFAISMCPNTSHQAWAQSDLGFRSRCGLKIFKLAVVAAILYIGTERF